MPRRSRRQRWALVVTAVAGTLVGSAAAAQPTDHHPPPSTSDLAGGHRRRKRGGLPRADWLFSDGRAVVTPRPETSGTTRAVWIAVLLGLGAGIGLTAAASAVVDNLNRRHTVSAEAVKRRR